MALPYFRKKGFTHEQRKLARKKRKLKRSKDMSAHELHRLTRMKAHKTVK